jgi:hypothetical protein
LTEERDVPAGYILPPAFDEGKEPNHKTGIWVFLAEVTLISGQHTTPGTEWEQVGLPPTTNMDHQDGDPPQVRIGVNWLGFGRRNAYGTYFSFPQECWEEHDWPEEDPWPWSYNCWLCVNGEEHGWIYAPCYADELPQYGNIYKVELESFEYDNPYPAHLYGYIWEEYDAVQPNSIGLIKSLFR